MERFLRLAREIHTRSLWQVLVIHLVGAWVGYQVSGEAARLFDLPSWFPEFTFVLLLLGVPVTVATAYAQGGWPGSTDEDEDDGTGEPPRLKRVFTWRNAILGGLLAFLLWLIVAVGWLLLAESLVEEFHRPAAVRATRLVVALAATQFR